MAHFIFEGRCWNFLKKETLTHYKSSSYRSQTNGAVEAASKNVKVILEKMVDTYQDWPEKLPYTLCGSRTSIIMSTGATPFSLVYRMEAVLPIEIEVPSLRLVLESELPEAEWLRARERKNG